jgi:hypothetical protein
MDLTPPDTDAPKDVVRPAPEPLATDQLEARAERSRPRGKPIAKRVVAAPAERGACDPPFTLDSAGIKRLKLNCL